MTVRDLGYRPYVGERLAASHNTWVLLRHGLGRVWSSWFIKLSVFFCWIPSLIAMAVVGLMFWVSKQQAMPVPGPKGAEIVRGLFQWQLWGFVLVITVRAGAATIAEDLTFKAFSFFFAKPVTPLQYVIGRTAAVAVFSFSVAFFPVFLLILVLVGTAAKGELLNHLVLTFPAVTYSLLVAVVMSLGSVAMSSLSASRVLTRTAWLFGFVLPYVLATVVEKVGHVPWLHLVSLPSLLGLLGDALFQVKPTGVLRWYHAAPVLAALSAGCFVLALRRLERAEVIA